MRLTSANFMERTRNMKDWMLILGGIVLSGCVIFAVQELEKEAKKKQKDIHSQLRIQKAYLDFCALDRA